MRAVTAGLAAAVAVVAFAGGAVVGQDGKDDKDAKIDPALLVGKWHPTKMPDSSVEFMAGGKVQAIDKFGKLVYKIDGTYQLDGAKLTLKLALGKKTKEEAMTVRSLTKTELVTVSEKGEERFTRAKAK